MTREAQIQDELIYLIKTVIKKFRFYGLEFSKVERDYPIDRKKADVVVFKKGEGPFLFIETKRGGRRGRLFDPLDVSVVGQVMGYAALYKKKHGYLVPYVATTNGERIVVFKTPEDVENYIDLDAVERGEYQKAFKPGMYQQLIQKYIIKDEEWI
ncbi:MAG: hypothetical protein ACK4SY_05465 [Pyrobaculum sp.]